MDQSGTLATHLYADERGNQEFQGVYVMAPEKAGPVKIGVSNSVAGRITLLQTGNWRKLRAFYFAYFFRPSPGIRGAGLAFANLSRSARYIEADAHRILRECDTAMIGEWFAVSVDDAIATIQKISQTASLIECGRMAKRAEDAVSLQDAAWSVASGLINAACVKLKNAD